MLNTVKISGFKSFADPVSLNLNERLIGVVGPNGCGKSNVADALRWVMGEGSARSLRADFMGEVIFSGTRDRKSLSRADVELVFDNHNNRFGGEYARNNEISVRREVFTDGRSRYYLNGILCRRRDIAGLFLGTGLGAHNYAIVQQGMINRFIEARPEEMRQYLEEAAGISYFRSQRQQAENNLRRTAENLDQVRERLIEINRQIARLESQSHSALRYRKLNLELTHLRACHYCRQLEVLNRQTAVLEQQIETQHQQLTEARLTRDRSSLKLDGQRVEHNRVHQALDQALETYYQSQNRVADLEKDIKRSTEEISRIDNHLQDLVRHCQQTREHIATEQARTEKLTRNMDQAHAGLEQLQTALDQSQSHDHQLEQQLAQVRTEHLQATSDLRVTEQQSTFNASLLQEIEQQQAELGKNMSQMKAQLIEARTEALTTHCDQLKQDKRDLNRQLEELETHWHKHQQENQRLEQDIGQGTRTLEESREHYQQLLGELTELRARQVVAAGHDPGDSDTWLAASRWKNQPRLRSLLSVESGWELTAELILARALNAVQVKAPLTELKDLPEFSDGELMLLFGEAGSSSAPEVAQTSIKRYIRAPAELDALLADIFVADDLDQALQLLNKLDDHQSVALREGVWLSRHWLRVLRKSDDANQVIVRERKIRNFEQQQSERQQQQEQLKADIERLVDERDRQSQQAAGLQEKIKLMRTRCAQVDVALATASSQLEQGQRSADQLTQAVDEVQTQIDALEQKKQTELQRAQTLKQQLTALNATVVDGQSKEQSLLQQHNQAREKYLAARDRLQVSQQTAEHEQQEHRKLQDHLQRFQLQLEEQNRHSEQQQQRRQELTVHIKQSREQLSQAIEQHAAVKQQRAELERQLKAVAAEIQVRAAKLEQDNRAIDQSQEQLSGQRIQLSQQRADIEHLEQNLVELQLEDDHSLPEEIEQMSDQEIEQRQERVVKILEKIGSVNLVAESEYQEQKSRAESLSNQVEDLENSSASLRATMTKMDQEIERKYSQTLKAINDNLRVLFQRIFSGGDAYLKEEEEGETRGTLFMAQPPGKKIAHIQQLSGGERTLSAIALMFAFFKLNPAPFCLLDEVDAPLDDINVHRYCSLLNEMSSLTQFIIITHNKITMSQMQVLFGVTMPDAGVSRIVDVDLQAARQAVG